MQQQHQVPQHSLQTVPICLNGQMAMATVDSSQSDSIDLSLVWPKTGESWTGHYSSDLVAKLLPGRPYSAFLQMLKAAIAERNRPSSDLRLHLDKPTIEHPDLQHLVLTYRTRFEQIECRLPLNRQRSDSARTETDADDEDRMLDAAGLRQAARQLEQENARLRRENAQLRPAASSAAQLRLEVAAMREAARGLEAELQSSVTASASPRGAVGNASSSAMKKLQSEARELRAMERMLQLRLSQ
uniref:Kinetochore protein SPC25 n=1 Tax=Macrostomum lignano TaxID=282301 RepID=A0A1I8I8M8_9PLAT